MNDTNTINATTETEMNLACAEAKRIAEMWRMPIFVYQTGPDAFKIWYAFAGGSDDGVLVARYDRYGNSF